MIRPVQDRFLSNPPRQKRRRRRRSRGINENPFTQDRNAPAYIPLLGNIRGRIPGYLLGELRRRLENYLTLQVGRGSDRRDAVHFFSKDARIVPQTIERFLDGHVMDQKSVRYIAYALGIEIRHHFQLIDIIPVKLCDLPPVLTSGQRRVCGMRDH